jgi:hypothetical protein
MKDELEKYIIKNKSEFDDHKLDEVDKLKFWSHISDELPEQSPKVISIWKKPVFRIAASIIILLGCSLSFLIVNNNNDEHSIVNEELYEIDNHYKLLVENQIQLIRNNTNLSVTDQDDFLLLIDDLDA